MEFKAQRISQTATLNIEGPIEDVFPLFGPVREKDWAYGWDPEIIYSKSHRVEEGMIFRTQAHDVADQYYLWTVTKLDPASHLIVYTVTASDRIWFISVQCYSTTPGTEVRVSYTYTGLTSEGSARNRDALKRMFAEDLTDWEKAINYYLKNGKVLSPADMELSDEAPDPTSNTLIQSKP